MESNHPYAQVNVKKEPEELCFDLAEIKWGYYWFYLETWAITWFITNSGEEDTHKSLKEPISAQGKEWPSKSWGLFAKIK